MRTKGRYADPWGAITEGREKAALGDVVGLTQFGVNLTRLKPGAASALRHWHEAEDEFGPWGKVYRDETGVIGLIQYGPANAFPRAQTLPAGPPSRDAVLVTCAYLTDAQSPWVLQSLFLAAIGESRDRGKPALEAFAYRYPAGEDFATRMLTPTSFAVLITAL